MGPITIESAENKENFETPEKVISQCWHVTWWPELTRIDWRHHAAPLQIEQENV